MTAEKNLPMSRLRTAAAVALTVAILDQATKWAILTVVMIPPRVIEITSFFNLTLGFNRGISFGMFGDGAIDPDLLSGLSLLLVACMAFLAVRAADAVEAGALGAVIGGALGNIADRLRHGSVTDFLDFHLDDRHWPTFNLADIGIVAGVGMLLLNEWRRNRCAAIPPGEKTS